MKEQNYANHARLVPGYHFVLTPVLLATCIGSLVNLWKSLGDHQRLYSASLIAVLSVLRVLHRGLCAHLRAEGPGPRHPLRGEPAAFRACGPAA